MNSNKRQALLQHLARLLEVDCDVREEDDCLHIDGADGCIYTITVEVSA